MTRSGLGAFLLIVFGGLAVRMLFILVSAPIDDAFITFRYAENIASGHGFVYNLGERVLGTTTPLFTLALVPFAALGLSPESAAAGISILCESLVLILIYRLSCKNLGRGAAGSAVAFYAFSYANVAACGLGMESALFQLLVVSSISFLAADRYAAASGMVGLAILTRPEGVLFAGIAGLVALVRGGRKRWSILLRSAGIVLAIIIPWFLFSQIYFGSAIPNSVAAKASKEGIGVGEWFQFFFNRNPLVLVMWVGALLGTVVGWIQACRAILFLAAWLVAYVLFFLAGRPPFFLDHYFAPAAMGLTILAGLGAHGVLTWLFRNQRRAMVASGVVAIAIFAVAFPQSFESARFRKATADRVFRPAAEWVAANTSRDAIVEAADIGYMGFYSGRRIFDASGLVSPEVWRERASSGDNRYWDVDLVLRKRPDAVVLPNDRDNVRRFVERGFLDTYMARKRFQVHGEEDLHPDAAASPKPSRSFEADYIIYSRR